MKQLLMKIKKRKLLSLMVLVMIIGIIVGALFISILSNENKELVTSNVTNFFDAIYNNKIIYKDTLLKCLSNNLILNIIIWLLGISIIGVPIVLFILFFNSFLLSFTFVSILYTFSINGVMDAIIYIIPHVLNLFCFFILIYYSLSFSKTLFNFLFRKKECNWKIIVTRYIKWLVISIILLIITGLIETFLVPFLIML